MHSLSHEIGQGSARISEIVGALKSYSYLGQAPVQAVDLHEGLDNTLVILRSKLKAGIEVHREYGADVPPIQAWGSELNQVWTNLLDNAADAMGGSGELTSGRGATATPWWWRSPIRPRAFRRRSSRASSTRSSPPSHRAKAPAWPVDQLLDHHRQAQRGDLGALGPG